MVPAYPENITARELEELRTR